MSSPTQHGFFSLPQELRDHIYSYLFAPATATTEHPFPECMPCGPRFTSYKNTCLVNRAFYDDAKAYFTKHIAPRTTFYLTSVASLRQHHHLSRAHHPILQHANFHIRCGMGAHAPRITVMRRSRAEVPTYSKARMRESEEVEALIRIQPGFRWWMDELPGFYRSAPATQTNYGFFPRTGPDAWKAARWGVAVTEHTGGEVCDSTACRQRRARALGESGAEVTEVVYPALVQRGLEGGGGDGGPSLQLSGFVWETSPLWQRTAPLGEAIMVLEGKLSDVCVPEDVVERYLKAKSQRMS